MAKKLDNIENEVRFNITEPIKRLGYNNRIVGGSTLTITGGINQIVLVGGVQRMLPIASHKIFISNDLGETDELNTPYFTESDLTLEQIKELFIAKVIELPKGFNLYARLKEKKD